MFHFLKFHSKISQPKIVFPNCLLLSGFFMTAPYISLGILQIHILYFVSENPPIFSPWGSKPVVLCFCWLTDTVTCLLMCWWPLVVSSLFKIGRRLWALGGSWGEEIPQTAFAFLLLPGLLHRPSNEGLQDCPSPFGAGSSFSVLIIEGNLLGYLFPLPWSLVQEWVFLETSLLSYQISFLSNKYVFQSLAVLPRCEAIIPESEDCLYSQITSFLLKAFCMASVVCTKNQMWRMISLCLQKSSPFFWTTDHMTVILELGPSD